MTRDEQSALISKLQGKVLEVFNEGLIRAGITAGEDTIYIASVAVAEAAAVLLWSQLPMEALEDSEKIKRMQDDWFQIFKDFSGQIIEHRLSGRRGDTAEDEDEDDGPSAWDRKRGA